MNILTFDIEEWYVYQRDNGYDKKKQDELDSLLKQILDLLDRRQMRGTFFCLGGMATEFPAVVKEIDKRGHEIGCHSNDHQWLNKITIDEVREDTRLAIDALEQCVGKKVKSYRAPAFSIGERNKIVFDILAENGIERDASVFPAVRDVGGFPNFGYKKPVRIKLGQGYMKEFPICTIKLLGKELAYSGGGYFRFFPLWFVKREITKADYAMTYFHLGDLMPDSGGVLTKEEYEAYFKEPGTIKARYVRYAKSHLGKSSAFKRLMKLMENTDFISIEQADQIIDWNNQAIVSM